MATTPIIDIKKEIVNFIRTSDILSVAVRGVTTQSDTGTFSAAATHTLATSPTAVKNIRSLVSNGVTLLYGRDYQLNWATGVITFTSAQTGAYTIGYDTGTTDKIYPDFPQPHLKLNDFPRIAVDIISGDTTEAGIGGGQIISNYIVQINCYDKDQDDVEAMIASVRSAIDDGKKGFYYMPFVSPTNTGPILVSEFGDKKIVQRNQDFLVQFIYEG